MTINIDTIFASGYADLDVLKAVLKELSTEITNIKDKKLPNIKYNEKVDLSNKLNVINSGADAGKFYIETQFDILNIDAVHIIADKTSASAISEPISRTFIDKIEGKRIIFTSNLSLMGYSNIYITYNY